MILPPRKHVNKLTRMKNKAINESLRYAVETIIADKCLEENNKKN